MKKKHSNTTSTLVHLLQTTDLKFFLLLILSLVVAPSASDPQWLETSREDTLSRGFTHCDSTCSQCGDDTRNYFLRCSEEYCQQCAAHHCPQLIGCKFISASPQPSPTPPCPRPKVLCNCLCNGKPLPQCSQPSYVTSTPGTYVVPITDTRCTQMVVTLCGGGGAGSNAGPGGGAGGCIIGRSVPLVSSFSQIYVQVGEGGSGSSSNVDGLNGNQSSFQYARLQMVAYGGAGASQGLSSSCSPSCRPNGVCIYGGGGAGSASDANQCLGGLGMVQGGNGSLQGTHTGSNGQTLYDYTSGGGGGSLTSNGYSTPQRSGGLTPMDCFQGMNSAGGGASALANGASGSCGRTNGASGLLGSGGAGANNGVPGSGGTGYVEISFS